MSLETLTLTLAGDGYEYTMAVLRGVDDTQEKPAFSLSRPGQSATQNIFLGIQGQQNTIRPRFYLHNDGTDKANGTAPTGEFTDDTVVTIDEQRRWLKRFIHAPAFDNEWSLDHDTGNAFDTVTVYLESLDVPTLQQSSPKWVEARMTLRVGSPNA